MSIPVIQTSFVYGEVSPDLFGHVDLSRMHAAASTFRNGFVGYRGGYYSRAGTRFVGYSKQTGRSYPPRMIPFQFSINQGLTLEFGNFYFRVISDGAFVTDKDAAITGATKAVPCVLNLSAAGTAAASATPNVGAVSANYVPGELVTLAGGTFITPAILAVTNTKIASLSRNSPGTGGYIPGDTIVPAGGTQSTPAQITVSTTQVVSATVAAGGSGGGTVSGLIVTGTTGTGTKFQANVNTVFGAIAVVNAITLTGSYSVNPTVIANEPVTGGGLVGAALSVSMGVDGISLTGAGVFTANAAGGTFTQASTSGVGVGATFNNALFGPANLTVNTAGVYTSFPGNPVAQASSSGTGLGATYTVATTPIAIPPFNTGDWIEVDGVLGMTELNGDTFVVHNPTGATVELYDVYGNPVDSTAYGTYTSGGTASRIFTLATPYADVDLTYLKYFQDKDVMTLCCVNQMTLTEYAPQELARTSDISWAFSPVVPAPSITPPTSPSGTPSSAGAVTYQYVITSVSPEDGTESVASAIATIVSGVNIAATAGTISLQWTGVATVNEYRVYKATPNVSTATTVPPPVGSLFGYAGRAFGNQFIDSNVVPDFSVVPPIHRNPFARGQIVGTTITGAATGNTSVTFVITSPGGGSGAVLRAVLVSGVMVGVIIDDPGSGYAPGDTVAATGNSTNPTLTLTVGPTSGTYPSVPTEAQQRRGFANTLNEPDTYWFSQPGALTNFDFRIPTIPSDAFSGTPWSGQVNGIQFMLEMPGGLIAFTGLSAWQLTGTGGSSFVPQPIGPDSQQVQPQAYNGCSATVPPVKIIGDIMFVNAKNSFLYSINYQIAANIYTAEDRTINSPHLFTGFTVKDMAWCEEPNKILWAVRDDGSMLALTYYRPQEVGGWARADTNGLFQSVCAVIEPPVDALYMAVQRFPGTHTAYMIERMDNRIWDNVEDTWCVDCALSLPQPTPNATLSVSSATGLGAISGYTGLVGGSGWSAGTTITVVDDNGAGPGTGAVVTPTIMGGVITALTIAPAGTLYTRPAFVASDPEGSGGGSGFSATAVLDNSATFTASAAVFAAPDVGKVIRMGGGRATITTFTNTTHVIANITSPIIDVIPNSGGRVRAQAAGSWTMTAGVSTIGGLRHLAGATVTGLADGVVIDPVVVSAAGRIAVPAGTTSAVAGLGFQAQLQSVYLDTGNPTIQGQRKRIADVVVRLQDSRDVKVGSNQPDGSTLSPPQLAPAWANMTDVTLPPGKGLAPYGSTVIPLYTGDTQKIPVFGGYGQPGQVAVQQDNPLPMNVLALVPDFYQGDVAQTKWPQRRQKGDGAEQ